MRSSDILSGGAQVDTEIFDVLVKDTGLTKEQLHDWAKTENELKQVCQPEEIAGRPTLTQTLYVLPWTNVHAANCWGPASPWTGSRHLRTVVPYRVPL